MERELLTFAGVSVWKTSPEQRKANIQGRNWELFLKRRCDMGDMGMEMGIYTWRKSKIHVMAGGLFFLIFLYFLGQREELLGKWQENLGDFFCF